MVHSLKKTCQVLSSLFSTGQKKKETEQVSTICGDKYLSSVQMEAQRKAQELQPLST